MIFLIKRKKVAGVSNVSGKPLISEAESVRNAKTAKIARIGFEMAVTIP